MDHEALDADGGQFRGLIDELIAAGKLKSGMSSVIFAAKAGEADEVRYRMSLLDNPEDALLLNGSLGESYSDIEYILAHADNLVKMQMLNKMILNYSADKSVYDSNHELAVDFIKGCANIFESAPEWLNESYSESSKWSISTIRGRIESYSGLVKLVVFLEHFFSNDDDFSSVFSKFVDSGASPNYLRFRAYASIVENVVVASIQSDLDYIYKGWDRLEGVLTNNGSNLFTNCENDSRSFIFAFKGLIEMQKRMLNSTIENTVVYNAAKVRIKSFAAELMSQLDKGVNESLVYFEDRNSTSKENRTGYHMYQFLREVVSHNFTNEFKKDLTEKMIISLCNGNNKNIKKVDRDGLIGIAEKIVDWKSVVGKLNKKGKVFLFENISSTDLIEPHLDKASRCLLLNYELSL